MSKKYKQDMGGGLQMTKSEIKNDLLRYINQVAKVKFKNQNDSDIFVMGAELHLDLTASAIQQCLQLRDELIEKVEENE